ncbi:MAG: amidohydrolase family protein [Sphingomonadales bacterium]|jgi:predicted amidohydrolase YtcJ|nr:amidohydrolase family protein [Sphingomonadales bacterium]MBK6492767.1 amidohydrolase family protein [Sphingomonadales bacterium]MBK6720362.1 amidohydrolase family protein [Sphingomonadales bacterium]MBL0002040.1 amidohydrolase family protein [Sphingomonadales bacterium]MBL0116493.1 amidohydrolase family protein [Sphingomonadales bacterium]
MFERRQALAMIAAAPLAAKAAATDAVTVFEAAKIVTMEPSLPSARFVAVAGGIVLGLADSLAELDPWTRGREVSVDRQFARNVLMPGLIDPHVHPAQSAVMLNIPFLAPDDWTLPSGSYPGVRTKEGYRTRLAQIIAASNAQPFICWGYHELFHGPLGRADLDGIAPDRPVIIWQRSFHDVILNSTAMRDWGFSSREAFDAAVSEAKVDPHHVDFDRGLFSETGLLIALARLRPAILSPDKVLKGMDALKAMLRKSGVTTISDMGTGIFAGFEMEAQMIRAAFEHPGNPSRVMLMPMANALAAEADPTRWLKGVEQRYASPHVRVDRRVKMLADGAFFAQNMRLNPPGYSDGHIGKWITEPTTLTAQFSRFWDAGFSLHIHVNGDEGLDVVLDGLSVLPPRRAQTITLEHLGYSTEAQNRRIAGMHLMVSAQPNYIRVLGDAYAATGMGPDRAATINRLGSLERKGVPLGLHSDFNMAPIDPLYLAWIAANRITLGGNLRAPAERLSLDKALRAVTIEAAQVIGMDHMVGSIAAGKKADFAVLDADPFALGAARLHKLKVLRVIFEGMVAKD